MCLASGCDSSEKSGADGAETKEPAGGADKPADDTKRKKRAKREKKDRGDASAKIGTMEWVAENAKAKLKNGVLNIDASRTDIADKKVSRQQLTMNLPGYKGPGTYEVTPHGSMFLGVGMDTEEIKKATTDDKQAEVATKAVSKSQTILLMKMTAVVESDDGTQIVGTFSQPALGKRYPAIADGKFRAILKKD